MTRTEIAVVNEFAKNEYVTGVENPRADRLARLKYEIFADRGAVWSKQSLLLFSRDIH